VFDPANPTAANSAMEQALSQGADFIAISGVTAATYQSALKEAMAKGVPVFTSYSTETPEGTGNGIYTDTGSVPQWQLFGKVMADYVISESAGAAKILYVDQPEYAVITEEGKAAKQTVAADCPKCSFDVVNTTVDDLSKGQVPSIVTNYLTAHPGITWVYLGTGYVSTGLASAFKAAGITGVKVISANPTLENQKEIADGFQTAAIGLPTAMSAWVMVDAMARHALGADLQPNWDSKLPAQVFTKDNLPNPPVLYDGPSDYQAQFKALWNV
jgi:ribose transport system substrate-binding protein